MNLSLRTKTHLIIIAILAILLLFFACSSPPAQPTSPDEPAAPSEMTTAPSDNSSTSQIPDESTGSLDRVDVVYFHRPQRCPTCLCFEERIRYVVNTYFQNELNGGKMTFGVYDIGDSKNTDIVKKYGAVGSQLFIDTVKDGTDNIKDIQDIWSWSCRTNKAGFDQQVKNVIERSLRGEE
ncbi:MAG: nitrophenyl compound nitroreductase subunit ArsF family protein [Dehalococcoidia bacterium]